MPSEETCHLFSQRNDRKKQSLPGKSGGTDSSACFQRSMKAENAEWKAETSRTIRPSLLLILFYSRMKRNYTKTIVIISILVALTAVGCYFSRPKAQTPKEIPPFVPTHEWKEILPGQAIPKVGLEDEGDGLGPESQNGLPNTQEVRQIG